jgi:hypothetical protein
MSHTDNSLDPGVAGVFQASFLPAGSSVPAADVITFAADDPEVVLAASPDGDLTKVVVTFPATGDAATSFNLACQLTGPDFPTPVNLTPTNVKINTVAPPPNLPTGGSIVQLS